MKRGATYGNGGALRWTLTREWGDGPTCCYIGHNPSTAGHDVDDPTSQAWTHFARAQGFGRYVAVNLYPYRTPDPVACRAWANFEQNGPDWAARDALMLNETIIATEAKKAARVVACWGAIAHDENWVEQIVEAIQAGEEPWPDIYCLGVTSDGSPKHPMARGKHRIARDQSFILWRPSGGDMRHQAARTGAPA